MTVPSPACVAACVVALGACGGGRSSAPDAASSPGTVALRLVIPPERSFCEQTSTCGDASRLTIFDDSGQAVSLRAPFCSTLCSSQCLPARCPTIPCQAQGFEVTTATTERQWDGLSYPASTCGERVPCVQPVFAPAGQYVARMCATPGIVTQPDAGPPVCTATGPVECVDVPFAFPGAGLVEGILTSSDGGPGPDGGIDQT